MLVVITRSARNFLLFITDILSSAVKNSKLIFTPFTSLMYHVWCYKNYSDS